MGPTPTHRRSLQRELYRGLFEITRHRRIVLQPRTPRCLAWHRFSTCALPRHSGSEQSASCCDEKGGEVGTERNKPTGATIIRILVLFFALANQTLVLFGHKAFPVTESELYEAISWLFTAGSSLVCWWKNQSFSDAAIGPASAYTLKIRSGCEGVARGRSYRKTSVPCCPRVRIRRCSNRRAKETLYLR